MTPRRIELRSDTFTRPTEAMRRAMYEAEVGDDVWDEDPTVDRLEALAAELTGKEAALFVSSGTQGNLVALLSHTSPGDEVILGDQSHIYQAETAGASVVGGLQLRTLPNGRDGRLQFEDVRNALRGADDVHVAPTGCVALENTHNRCGGTVLTPEALQLVADVSHAAGVPVHLDGARIFNAAVVLGITARDLSETVDSITFCLSKGLGAPAGSVLCGTRDFIWKARRWRKMLGGGMRQVGVLAAPGIVALECNRDRLAEDHANARFLAEGLHAIPGVYVDMDTVQSNIVVFDIAGTETEPAEFVAGLRARGVHLDGGTTRFRAVTSYEVSEDDMVRTLDAVTHVLHPAVPVGA